MAIPVQQFPFMTPQQAAPALGHAHSLLDAMLKGGQLAKMPTEQAHLRAQMERMQQQTEQEKGMAPFKQALMQAEAKIAPLKYQKLKQDIEYKPLLTLLKERDIAQKEALQEYMKGPQSLYRMQQSMPLADRYEWQDENQQALEKIRQMRLQDAMMRPGMPQGSAVYEEERARLFGRRAARGVPPITGAQQREAQTIPTTQEPRSVEELLAWKPPQGTGVQPLSQQLETMKGAVPKGIVAPGTKAGQSQLSRVIQKNFPNHPVVPQGENAFSQVAIDARNTYFEKSTADQKRHWERQDAVNQAEKRGTQATKRAVASITMLNFMGDNREDFNRRINEGMQYVGPGGKFKSAYEVGTQQHTDALAAYKWLHNSFPLAFDTQVKFIEGMGATDEQMKTLRALTENPLGFFSNPQLARKQLNMMFDMYDSLGYENLRSAQPAHRGIMQVQAGLPIERVKRDYISTPGATGARTGTQKKKTAFTLEGF